jgi:hypothetical protein
MLALAFLTSPPLKGGTGTCGQVPAARQRRDHHGTAGAAELIALTAGEIGRLLATATQPAAG